jgi:Fe2+ or Zn2+ uptake regulation protein
MTETSTKTYQELEEENYDLKEQKDELIDLLTQATDWNWLTAKEYAEETNSETLDIQQMQNILDKLNQYKKGDK